MLVIVVQANNGVNHEIAVKETLSDYFESMGKVIFPKVEAIANALVLKMHIYAKDGSVLKFHEIAKPFLSRHKDIKWLFVKEEKPDRII